MRKLVIGLTVAGLVTGALASPAPAKKKPPKARPRTVEVRYEDSSPYFMQCVLVPECRPTVSARPHERFITVEVIDDLSPTGFVDIVWSKRSPEDPGYVVVCGATEEPQPIPAGAALEVYAWAHPAPECPTGFSRSGTVRITFTS